MEKEQLKGENPQEGSSVEAKKECFKKVGMASKAKCHLDAEQNKDRKVTFEFGNMRVQQVPTQKKGISVQ